MLKTVCIFTVLNKYIIWYYIRLYHYNTISQLLIESLKNEIYIAANVVLGEHHDFFAKNFQNLEIESRPHHIRSYIDMQVCVFGP